MDLLRYLNPEPQPALVTHGSSIEAWKASYNDPEAKRAFGERLKAWEARNKDLEAEFRKDLFAEMGWTGIQGEQALWKFIYGTVNERVMAMEASVSTHETYQYIWHEALLMKGLFADMGLAPRVP